MASSALRSFLLTFLILIFAVFLLSCEYGPSPTYLVVEYRAEGTVSHANITYLSGTYYNQVLPWSLLTEHAKSGDEFYLSAQSNDASGDLTVSVTVDSVPFASETTSTPFGFVAIYGSIP